MPDNINAEAGSATANSYASSEESDLYFDDIYGKSEWEDVDDDEKDRLLLTATKMIDALPIRLLKADESQALKFPVQAPDDGFTKAKEACILQAFYLYWYHEIIAEGRGNRIAGVKSETVGKIGKQVAGLYTDREYDPMAIGLLKDYLDTGTRIRRS